MTHSVLLFPSLSSYSMAKHLHLLPQNPLLVPVKHFNVIVIVAVVLQWLDLVSKPLKVNIASRSYCHGSLSYFAAKIVLIFVQCSASEYILLCGHELSQLVFQLCCKHLTGFERRKLSLESTAPHTTG